MTVIASANRASQIEYLTRRVQEGILLIRSRRVLTDATRREYRIDEPTDPFKCAFYYVLCQLLDVGDLPYEEWISRVGTREGRLYVAASPEPESLERILDAVEYLGLAPEFYHAIEKGRLR